VLGGNYASEISPMTPSFMPASLQRQGRGLFLSLSLAAGLGLAAPQPAQALTVVLDFVSAPTTDTFGVGTLPETFATWGFTTLNAAGVRAAVLNAVNNDYLNYPTVGANALSPLPNGKQLNINFVTSLGQTPPSNGDSEFYYVAIGDANPNQAFLGQACLGCVRNSSGVSTVANATIFGSVLTDTIAGLLPLATNDAERINLLAGTVAHEIGHSLTLQHPNSALPNPGASTFSVMATGAAPTSMPNIERTKDRAFAYSEFATLIQTVGLRNVSPVPETGTTWLLAMGLVALGLRLNKVARKRELAPAV
jgi:hypothetical protein